MWAASRLQAAQLVQQQPHPNPPPVAFKNFRSRGGAYGAGEAGNCSFHVFSEGGVRGLGLLGPRWRFLSQAGCGGEGAVGDARAATWETGRCERCARSWSAVVVAAMEEGGRDKASLQPQQPPVTAPGGTDEKQGGKERRDAGDKDKEQELVRRGPRNRRKRPRAESRRLCRPRVRSPEASP